MKYLIFFYALLTPWLSHAALHLELGVLPGLQYDIKQFVVRPGEVVAIHFNNNDGMQHNLVFGTPGSRQQILLQAIALGADGPARNYIPDSPLVLHSTPVIAMNEDARLKFRAPESPGDYPFVCTFPGHGFLMHGIMKVDADLPQTVERNSQQLMDKAAGAITRPVVVRAFLPHSSPAAIAVALPGGQHYIWDAGTVHLRAVWSEGGWLDYGTLRRHLESNGKPVVQFPQHPHYLEGPAFPFELDGSRPTSDFKGYRLIDGYPEFRYTFSGVDVRESIRLADIGKGIVRSFYMKHLTQPIRFYRPTGTADRVTCSAGQWEGDVLRLSPEEAASFTITILEPGS
jgi:uncharacterized cupredoxin-like copper-binding protein